MSKRRLVGVLCEEVPALGVQQANVVLNRLFEEMTKEVVAAGVLRLPGIGVIRTRLVPSPDLSFKSAARLRDILVLASERVRPEEEGEPAKPARRGRKASVATT